MMIVPIETETAGMDGKTEMTRVDDQELGSARAAEWDDAPWVQGTEDLL
jgi:hypothetical protein